MSDFPFWTCLIFFTWLLSAQELICDGMVKANAAVQSVVSSNIDFGSVSVVVFTTEGHRKSEVQCIRTGVFFLNFYERGDYVLKVQGPEGWTFEPTEIPFSVTSLDSGSCEKKIEFKFTGFSLSGFVHGPKLSSCAQSGSGPKGIEILLTDDSEASRTCLTDDQGRFVFDNVFPGKFALSANTGSFSALNGVKREIEMNLENTVLAEAFEVGGTSMTGHVLRSNKAGLSGVQVDIRSSQGDKLFCGQNVCSTTTDASGAFVFDDLACGIYEVTASYVLENTRYKFKEDTLTASVLHSATEGVEFTLVGMSSNGAVRDLYGNAVVGATVLLNDKVVGETDREGQFHVDVLVERVKYKLTARASGLQFPVIDNVNASPSLPVLSAKATEVCGIVDPKKPGVSRAGRKVTVENTSGQAVTSGTTDREGRYCVMLGLGEFRVKPVVSASESRAGIVLSPPFRQVSLEKENTQQNIDFFQAQVQVGGNVVCLDGCGSGVSVTLTPKQTASGGSSKQTASVSATGAFAFPDVTPGNYHLSVKHAAFCWENEDLEVEVSFEDIDDLSFQQKGYVVDISTSHEIDLDVVHNRKQIDTFSLQKGKLAKCLEAPGVYEFRPNGCYKFDKDSYTFDTSSPTPISMRANAFLIVGGVVVSPKDRAPDVIDITVDSAGGSSRGTIIRAMLHEDMGNNQFMFQYSFWGVQSEHYTFQPKSTGLLFYPQTHSVSVSGQVCPPPVEQFQARPGLFIEGEVRDGIQGAKITITDSTKKFQHEHETDASGKYSVGPLYDNLEYHVEADKEGYEITRIDEFNFNGLKLGTVAVKIVDDEGSPLSEVMVTLTNGDGSYMKHLSTEQNGVRTFMGLMPGDYFVRTTMKEYRFTQGTSTDVYVSEGADESFEFRAKRISYSVFGSVQTLSRIPVNDVSFEAIPLDNQAHYEETRSTSDGQFRLRGLQPGHSYRIQVKTTNQNVSRSTPESFEIMVEPKDYHGADFVVFYPLKKFSLSGFVDTSSAEVLEVQLARTTNERKVLSSIRLESDMRYFEFPSIPKSKPNEKYIVRCVAPDLTHQTAITEPVFVQLDAHRHVDMLFATEARGGESASSSGYLPFLLWLGILLCILNYDTVLPFVSDRISKFMNGVVGRILKDEVETSETLLKRKEKPVKVKAASPRKTKKKKAPKKPQSRKKGRRY